MGICKGVDNVICLERSMLKLIHPANWIISGPTMTGKTTFIFSILDNLENIIVPSIENVVYIYGVFQEEFRKYEKKVFFTNSLEYLTTPFKTRTLLILDDSMMRLGDSKELLELFTVGAHHRSISIMLVLQNIFSIGRVFKSLRDNTQYYYITEYLQDRVKLKYFARQIDSDDLNYFMASYNDAVSVDHRGLFIDIHAKSPIRRLAKYRANVYQLDGQILYIPKRLKNIFSTQNACKEEASVYT